MGKADHGQRRRTEILAAGARLFALHGYFHTSTSDILEAVGVSKGAFYHHFKSKQALAIAALEKSREDYEHRWLSVVREAKPGTRFSTALALIVELNNSAQWSNCSLMARLVLEMRDQQDELSEHVADTANWLIELWSELIADDQAVGAIDDALESRAIAELTVSALLGAVGCAQLRAELVNLQNTADLIRSLLLV